MSLLEEVMDEVAEYDCGYDLDEEQREVLAEVVNDPLLFIETVLRGCRLSR